MSYYNKMECSPIPRNSSANLMMSSRATCVLFLLLFSTFTVDAAHSRRRAASYRETERYDRSITTFSPDGRLEQVEYGMEASLRGSTVTAMQNREGICFLVKNSSLGKVHRLDHHMWLVTAGLSGDARLLASALRDACQKFRLNFGEAPTVKEVAQLAGRVQHELTRTGGRRPLGCTAIVIGIDPPYDEESLGTPRLFQTDPGGIVEECTFCAAGKGRVAAMKTLGNLVDKEPSQCIIELAAQMTKRVLKEVDDPEDQAVDVWTIKPHAFRRGGMQATCYRNITKSTIKLIRDS